MTVARWRGPFAVAAAFALAAALVASGGFSGWIALVHATAGRRTLAAARVHPEGPELWKAVRELSVAVALVPLSRHHRTSLESAIELAIDRLGPDLAATLAPAATMPRIVFIEALWRRQAERPAGELLATIEAASPEVLEVLSDRMLRKLGDRFTRTGRCASAIPILEATRGRGSAPGGLEIAYARCLLQVGEPDRALPVLRGLRSSGDTGRWPSFLLGEAELASGHLREAEAVADALTAARPEFYYGWHLRGRVLTAAGKRAEAARSFERALALRPAKRWLAEWIRRLRSAPG